MARILSIQSHVCYGYVGNRVASFALQRLKHDVITINTVQFSNHTGYGSWTGKVFELDHVRDIWQGIKQRIDLRSIDGLVTGYLGQQPLGLIVEEIIADIKSENKQFIYCLDPVFGDVGRDIFVPQTLAEFYKDQFISLGDVITPNHFEFNYLTQQNNQTLSQLTMSAQKLINDGINMVLITSYQGTECSEDEIGMVLIDQQESWFMKTPQFDFKTPPNGSGDLVTALVMDAMLKDLDKKTLLEQLATKMYGVFENNFNNNERELQLIESQDLLVESKTAFTAKEV